MKNALTLIKLNCKIILNPSRILSSRPSMTKKRAVLMTLLFAMLLLYFAVISAVFAYNIMNALKDAGLIDLAPVLYFAAFSALILITSVFSAQGYLYKSKDINMLLSLPVSHAAVLISKFAMMYAYDLLFALLILAPTTVIYFYFMSFSVLGVICSVLAIVFAPLLPMGIGTLIAYFTSLASRHIRNKNLVTTAVSILFIVVYFFAVQNGDSIFEYIQKNGGDILNAIKGYYFPAALYINALMGNVWQTLLFVILNFCVISAILPLMFGKYADIAEKMQQSYKITGYKITAQKSSGVLAAAYKKEARKYFGTSIYFMNTAIGMIMLTILAVSALFIDSEQLLAAAEMEGAEEFLEAIITAMALFCIFLCCTTCSSISLEGKSLWIYKSAPITERNVFLSKILVNLTVTLPLTLIDCAILSYAYNLSYVAIAVLPICASVFSALLGLIINLALPKLEFPSETIVVKQSSATLVSMLASFGIIGLCALAYYLARPESYISFALCASAITVLLSVLIWRIIITWGVKKFKAL